MFRYLPEVLVVHSPYFPEFSKNTSSIALLALKRFCRRSLRQMGIWAIALLLIVGTAARSPEPQPLPFSSSDLIQLSPATVGAPENVLEDASKSALSLGDRRPFQAVRPRMTNHRLTTSRFSIPTEGHQAQTRLVASK